MEVRPPLVTPQEIAALFGREPRTVHQELEAILAQRSDAPRESPPAALRRLIARTLHGAAEAIYPATR